jgi:hypothetical protein
MALETLLAVSTIACAPSNEECAEFILIMFIPLSCRVRMKPASHILSEIVHMIFVFLSILLPFIP